MNNRLPPLLIRNAEIDGIAGLDLLVSQGRISAIETGLEAPPDARAVDAHNGALLPGLHDHHLHLAALAAARNSLECSPAAAGDARALADHLRTAAAGLGDQSWLRGIGYHDSVAGDIDAAWLDAQVDWCPVRVQHRGGRLWVFNSRALELLQPTDDAPLEAVDGCWTGRLYEGDVWLRTQLRAHTQDGFPDLAAVSRELAGYGITGVTDTTPHNNIETLAQFRKAHADGSLVQSVLAMGDPSLDAAETVWHAGVTRGAHKFHLLESDLPDLEALVSAIARSHEADRPVAFHCVTRTELVFALAALRAAGVHAGDRIEHASVTPPELLAEIKGLGLTVVTQPAFIHERGDQYLADVASEDKAWLYRLQGFRQAGVPLAGSSDAPFATPDPWRAMQAAVERTTRNGWVMGSEESLTPEQALALFLAPLETPGGKARKLCVGAPADLCLLAQSWQAVRQNLQAAHVRCAVAGGRLFQASD